MNIRERFLKRIFAELQSFKENLLRKDKETIFGESYKIETFVNLYEILVEQADRLPDVILLELLNQSAGILESLYQEWLKREDNFYQELKEYVDSALVRDSV